jgi:hypothetical protein
MVVFLLRKLMRNELQLGRQIQRGREHFVQLHEVHLVFVLFSNISYNVNS